MTDATVRHDPSVHPVLAVHTDADAAVTTTVAQSLATLTEGTVQHCTLGDGQGTIGRLGAIHDAVRRTSPSVTVIAAPNTDAGLWWEFARTATGPVVVIPADAQIGPVRRVLLPLDGTPTSATVVPLMTELLAADGVKLVALHVFDPATVPPYWDHPAHAYRAWSEEFLRQQCPRTGVQLEVRTGEPREAVLDVAQKTDADLIVLGWSQQLDQGRAAVVRATLEQARVPVLLIPVGTQPSGPSPLLHLSASE